MTMWLATLLLAAPKAGKNVAGVPIFGASKSAVRSMPHTAAEQAELVTFLTQIGYPQYATPEFIQKMDEEFAYDSIEDLAFIEEDGDHEELGIPEDHAEAIQTAAHKELMRRFLADLPGGSMERHLNQLHDEGFEEIEDLEDLDEGDVSETGLSMTEIDMLVEQAELHSSRRMLVILLVTHTDKANNSVPFRDPAVHKPLVEAMLAAGVRTLMDIGTLTPGKVEGLSDTDLAKIQSDKRVLAQMNKSEL